MVRPVTSARRSGFLGSLPVLLLLVASVGCDRRRPEPSLPDTTAAVANPGHVDPGHAASGVALPGDTVSAHAVSGNAVSGVAVSEDDVARASYVKHVESVRAAKDVAFRGEGSPIPEGSRATFTGLIYYPIDSALMLPARMEKIDPPEPVRIVATKGDIRRMLRVGRLAFTIGGKKYRLAAYRQAPDDPVLFVPFRDATSGDETYAVGRYIDVEEESRGSYLLDFNLAYNPYCAYNDNYTCPVVPAENILPIPIRAGEMLPKGAGH